jgi:DNA-directed RNA polymerase III subunit RPC7
MLKRKDLHEPFFPRDIFDGYFNPKKKRQGERELKPGHRQIFTWPLQLLAGCQRSSISKTSRTMPTTPYVRHSTLDHLYCLTSTQDKSEDERSEAGSQPEVEDYDVEEEDDNDYAENYFDNGEGDDVDDLGGGGGEEGGGAPGLFSATTRANWLGSAVQEEITIESVSFTNIFDQRARGVLSSAPDGRHLLTASVMLR